MLFNTVMLAADVAALAWVRRRDPGDRWLPVVVAGIFSLILGAAVSSQHARPGIFAGLRMFSWAIFLHGPLVFMGSCVWVRGSARGVFAGVGVLLTAIGIDAFLIEPTALQTTVHVIPVEGLSRSIRIAVLADVQTDAVGDHERAALRAAKDAEPDLILFPGDLVHAGDRAAYDAVQRDLNALLRQFDLSPPLGVYAVKGNVDWGPGAWLETFDRIDVHASDETQQHDLGGLMITALSFHDGFDTQLRVPDPGKPHLVFAHGPDFALGDIEADVLVAGHTHGGQVQLPFIGPLITFSRVPRAWATGRTELAPGKTLVVSNGVGMERHGAPQLRFLCKPEVVILDLVPAGEMPR